MGEYFVQGLAVGFLAGTAVWILVARASVRHVVNKLRNGEMIDGGKGVIVFIRESDAPRDS